MANEGNEGNERHETSRGGLRREARALSWEALTEDQRHAAAQVLSIVAEHVQRTSHRGPSPARDSRDRSECRHRAEDPVNSVILLDGPRGTGKTTVLYTLARLFDLSSSDSPTPLPAPHQIPRHVRVVPVGPLDLHPLGEDTEIVLAFGGLLKDVVDSQGHTSDAVEAWNRFVEAVATTNVGSRERLARVGPDQLSIELRTGVPNLHASFTQLVDAMRKRRSTRAGARSGGAPTWRCAKSSWC
ncbi:MAG: hypothetical protein OHK0013_29080 [Sandaracinaceae bacterium]